MTADDLTLEQVISAARIRKAPLTPETAGYIVLAVADTIVVSPGVVRDRHVRIRVDGSVAVVGAERAEQPEQAERSVRQLLHRLLTVSVGSKPALLTCARRAQPAGLPHLVEELEAALIPANRDAAQRSIARLAREAAKVPAAELAAAAEKAAEPPARPAPPRQPRPAAQPQIPDVAAEAPEVSVPIRHAGGAVTSAPLAVLATEPEFTGHESEVAIEPPVDLRAEGDLTEVASSPVEMMDRTPSPAPADIPTDPASCAPSMPGALTPQLATYDPNPGANRPKKGVTDEAVAAMREAPGAAGLRRATPTPPPESAALSDPSAAPIEVVGSASDSSKRLGHVLGLSATPGPVEVVDDEGADGLKLDGVDEEVVGTPMPPLTLAQEERAADNPVADNPVAAKPPEPETRPPAPVPAAQPSDSTEPAAAPQPSTAPKAQAVGAGNGRVEELVASFSVGGDATRGLAGELKKMAGLEPTPPPPAAVHEHGITDAALARASTDEVPPEPRVRPRQNPAEYARPRAPRTSLAIMAALLFVLIGAAVLIFLKYPSFFTGR